MAQRTSKRKRTMASLGWVKLPQKKAHLSANDNIEIAASGMRLSEQKTLRKRADDLAWQVKFAAMKLHHWNDPDCLEWGPLDKLLEVAQTQYRDVRSCLNVRV